MDLNFQRVLKHNSDSDGVNIIMQLFEMNMSVLRIICVILSQSFGRCIHINISVKLRKSFMIRVHIARVDYFMVCYSIHKCVRVYNFI